MGAVAAALSVGPGKEAAWAGVGVLIVAIFFVGFQAARSVTGERVRNTLVDLLLLPIPRREILVAKAVGCLARVRGMLWIAACVAAFGLATGAIPIATALPALIAATAAVAEIAVLGIWASIVSPHSTRSLLLFTLETCACGPCPRPPRGRSPRSSTRRTRPAGRISSRALGPGSRGRRSPRSDVGGWRAVGAVVGLVVHAGLTAGVWWDACRRFENEGKR